MSRSQSASKTKDLNTIKLPYIKRNQIIFSPGVHNGDPFTIAEIEEAFSKFNPKDKRTKSMYRDHDDDWRVDPVTGQKTILVGAKVGAYIGSIENMSLRDGFWYGDLHIVDMDTAIKLAYQESQFAVSPAGRLIRGPNGKKTFRILNWAVVINPAQKQLYIQHQGTPFAMHDALEAFSSQEMRAMDFEQFKTDIGGMLSAKIDPLVTEQKTQGERLTALEQASKLAERGNVESNDASEKLKEKKPKESVIEQKLDKILAHQEAQSSQDTQDKDKDKGPRAESDTGTDTGTGSTGTGKNDPAAEAKAKTEGEAIEKKKEGSGGNVKEPAQVPPTPTERKEQKAEPPKVENTSGASTASIAGTEVTSAYQADIDFMHYLQRTGNPCGPDGL